MKKENAISCEFDFRKLKDMFIAIIVGFSTIYIANTEVINALLGKYIEKDTLAVIIVIFTYIARKFLKDYSK